MKWAFQLYDLDGDGVITREVRKLQYKASNLGYSVPNEVQLSEGRYD
jgi:Ca2+-binding EF-hand superfamily protein